MSPRHAGCWRWRSNKGDSVKWFHWLALAPFKVAATIIMAAMSLLKGA